VTGREELIDTLSSDLTPTRRFRPPQAIALAWLAGSWLFVVSATLLVAPMRPGAFGQLLDSPHFAVETLIGLWSGVAAISAGVFLAFPSRTPWWRWVAWGAGAVALWFTAHVFALWVPALEPSMLGKRPFCEFETLAYGTAPMIAGLLLLRRYAAFRRAWAGAMLGAAGGALPALLMQLACMYVPEHILLFHLAPVALLALLGALLGPVMLRRI
jgi:hypothetical protein